MSSPPVDPWSGQPERGGPSNSQPPGPPAAWDRQQPQGGWTSAPTPPGTPTAGAGGAWPPPPPVWGDPARPAPPATAAWPNQPPPENPPTRPYATPGPAGPPGNRQPPADPWRPGGGGGTPPAPSGGSWAAPQPRPASDQPTQVYGNFPPIPPADPPTNAPGYGQPTSGAPGYGQPTSGPPGYGQPTSGAPGYGPPPGNPPYGQPAAFPTGAEPPAPGKRSRFPLVLSLGLVGLLVLCLGGGGLAYVALSDSEEPASPRAAAPGSAASPGADAGEPAASNEPSPDPRIRLVAPKTLGGRPKSTDPELKALADDMVRDMKSTVRSENSAIGAFYGSPEKENMVMIAGASGFVLNPKRELDDAVKALSTELSVRRMSTVSPGPLGGVAKCGDGTASEIPLGVCVWADQGSVGMIVMFFSSGSQAKAEFTSLRGQVEKRS